MPIVCINRPNRTKPRRFNTADVQRIAGYAIKDGHSPIKILASVIVAAGFGAIFCKVALAMSFVRQAKEVISRLLLAIASSRLLQFLVVFFGGVVKLTPLGKLLTVVYGLGELIFAITGNDDPEEAIDIESVALFAAEVCEQIKQVITND